ncbi:MAG: hypothetical protein SH850_26995 [Planctomycetaceae bacterium]|nr:hypothetical protein [Planctomycetaceae bacterium]
MTRVSNSGEDASSEGDVAEIAAASSVRGTMLGRLLGGSAVSLLGFFVTVLQAILQVPLLLAVWPGETFASWVTAVAMHALLVSGDVGFHSFIGVEIILIGLEKTADVRSLFAASLRIWAILSLVQAAVVGVVWCVPGLMASVAPDTARLLASAAGPLAVLVVQWILVGSLHSLMCRVLLAGGQTVLFQWLGIVHRTLLFAAIVTAAWFGLGVNGVALAHAGVATVSGVVVVAYVIRDYPGILPRWADGTCRSAWTLFGRSTGLTFSSMLEQLSVGGLTTLVAGAFHELQVAAFSTMRSLANFVTQAAGVVMNPAVPELGRSAGPSTIHKASLIIESAFVIGLAPLALAVSLAAPWMPALYGAWTRHELPFDVPLFIGLVVAVLVRQVGMPLQYFLLATNRVRPQFTASAIRVVVLYGFLPVTIPWMGLGGVGAALVVAEVCCTFYLVTATSRSFVECGGTLEPRSIHLASSHALIAAAAISGVLLVGGSQIVCIGSALVAHGIVLGLQIRRLPSHLIVRAIRAGSLGRLCTRIVMRRA